MTLNGQGANGTRRTMNCTCPWCCWNGVKDLYVQTRPTLLPHLNRTLQDFIFYFIIGCLGILVFCHSHHRVHTFQFQLFVAKCTKTHVQPVLGAYIKINNLILCSRCIYVYHF